MAEIIAVCTRQKPQPDHCSCAAACIGRARYLEKELLELKGEDQMKGTCFYNTLKEYLLNGNNVSMTSKKLFIHRNTMIYRLGKINEILGVDINAPGIAPSAAQYDPAGGR